MYKAVLKHPAVSDVSCFDWAVAQDSDIRCLLHEWSFCTPLCVEDNCTEYE
jgi:hypothetical protein